MMLQPGPGSINMDSSTPSLRVMVVEDDTLVGLGLQAQLQRLSHEVVGRVGTPREAQAMFTEKTPDLVLMDIRIDGGDGIELAGQLLAQRKCPMIICSAFSDPELIKRAGAAGVFGYLIKPITPESLAAQIEVAIARFAEQADLEAQKLSLQNALEVRKLSEKAKGILMRRLNLTEPEAHRRLQTESQNRRLNLAEMSKRIIESEELLGGGM